MDFFYNLGAWNWFIVGATLLVLETIVPGVHFVWFGVAAVIVGILAVVSGVAWQVQLIIFAIVSIATVFVVRRFADPATEKSDEPHLNVRGSQYIGRMLVVAEDIQQGRGKVHVDDTVWHAQGEDAAAGQKVRVVGVNGTALVVERADADE